MNNTSALSPWEAVLNFGAVWNLEKMSWIIITILIVLGLHKLITRSKYKPKATWIQRFLWILSIIAWCFLMYMVIWPMIKGNILISMILLLLSTLLVVFSFRKFFINSKLENNPSKKIIIYRTFAGSVFAILVFSMIAFMGMNQQDFGISILMGTLLGAFISLTWFTFTNKDEVNDLKNNNKDKNEDNDNKDEDDEEIDYTRKIGIKK